MLPAAVISSSQAAQRRLSFYIAVNLASVLAPGIVIVVAAVFLIESAKGPPSPLLLLTHFKNYTGASAFLVSLVGNWIGIPSAFRRWVAAFVAAGRRPGQYGRSGCVWL